jgi:dTDP-4-amino-4,6-dideoxygalactose transaminase
MTGAENEEQYLRMDESTRAPQIVDGLSFIPIRTKPLPREFPGAHLMCEEEEAAVLRVCRSRSLFRYDGLDPQGEVSAFEREFCSFLEVRYAVAVTSGTSALHTALSALRAGPGQEIIVPAYLWVSVVAAVVNLGAIPVLAEIDDTFCLKPESVRQCITSRTAGIVLVHMNGAPGDAPKIAALAAEHGIFLLEDCAQCVGGSIGGRKVGTFGDMAIFSFQLNKNFSSGEAGCVVTNNDLLYRRALACHDSGYSRDGQEQLRLDDEEAMGWGRGCRLDELRAAVLRVQLRRLPEVIASMQRSKHRLRSLLSGYTEVSLRRVLDPAGDTGCFLLLTLPDRASAGAVNRRLRAHGIATSCVEASNVILEDYGLHIYFNIPALVSKLGTDERGTPWTLEENRGSIYDYHRGVCPRSDDLFARTQMLTIASNLEEQDVEDILAAFREVLDIVLPQAEKRILV